MRIGPYLDRCEEAVDDGGGIIVSIQERVGREEVDDPFGGQFRGGGGKGLPRDKANAERASEERWILIDLRWIFGP